MRMKCIFVIFLLVFVSSASGQTEYKIYTWDELVGCSPDTVYAISFRKQKLDSLPSGLFEFRNLMYLDLEKNKLTELPNQLTHLTSLQHLNLGKNKYTVFPLSICQLKNLRSLKFNQNEISYLPESIGDLGQLEELDLFKNPIRKLPESLTQLKKLKLLELRNIKFSPEFQDKWLSALPDTKILFDPPCDCMK